MNKEEAIAAIESSCLTHIKWIDYYARGGELNEVAGDREHHEECVIKYLAVIEYIKST